MSESRPALPFPGSLCHRCSHVKLVASARSTFLMCRALEQKYPPQPVTACPAFEAPARRDPP